MTLSIIAKELGPVTNRLPPHEMPGPDGSKFMMVEETLNPAIMATHTFATAPQDLDVVLVPGGAGNRLFELGPTPDMSIENFLVATYPKLKYLLSVCTGSATLARAGLLDGKKATSNKAAWSWVVTHGENVTWVPTARWVVDGNIWTSSGIAAGMDMTYAFIREYYGADDDMPLRVVNLMEYAPHTDAHWDPFSVVHNVPGADAAQRGLADCTKPAGY